MTRKLVSRTYIGLYVLLFFLIVFVVVIFGLARNQENIVITEHELTSDGVPQPTIWYLYRNEDFGFSITYPSTWSGRTIDYGDDQSGQFVFQSNDFQYTVRDGILKGASLVIHVRGKSFDRISVNKISGKQPIFIGEEKAYQWFAPGGLGSAPNSDLLIAVVENGQYEYYIMCEYAMNERADALRICREMVESIKFQVES